MTELPERRGHFRHHVLEAVLIQPNGHAHEAQVIDLSGGGVRMHLPEDWLPADGAALRIFFRVDDEDEIELFGHVARVAVDHMGVAFDPAQEALIRQLFSALDLAD